METWFDPLEMFRQIAPNGIVNKSVRGSDDDDDDEKSVSEADKGKGETASATSNERNEAATQDQTEKPKTEETEAKGEAEQDNLIKEFNEKSTLEDKTEESPKPPAQNAESTIVDPPTPAAEVDPLIPKDAIAAPANSEETRRVHEEMSNITAAECPFLMNKE